MPFLVGIVTNKMSSSAVYWVSKYKETVKKIKHKTDSMHQLCLPMQHRSFSPLKEENSTTQHKYAKNFTIQLKTAN